MSNLNVYLKAEQNVEVKTAEVYLKDIAKIYASDSHMVNKIKAVKIYTFYAGGPKRQVISILKIIELIEAACPQVTINSLGEADVLLEWIKVRKHKQPLQFIKIFTAGAVSFFGTAFTIMAFHNDISINNIFRKFYEMVMGQPADGYTILEISYSVGLALGIIVFFNHIGGRRITKDPTPIEVAMRHYEDDVNKALIATADREGGSIDVD
ncbi:MAG: stage V sporulation protein AA [Lachnospiraceae bacterium]|jgi:stage V sporulation protein AA|nr:stage V sporulation protein AA [Lachnospiraceae bacterium]